MKRVKIMLSGIMVLALVAGALAFKAKSENVCAYATTGLATEPATKLAPIVHATNVPVQSITFPGVSTQYATTYLKPTTGTVTTCTTISTAIKSRTLTLEN